MVLLNNLEKLRLYRAIITCMQEEEKYNGKRKVMSASEILELSRKRFYLMQSILNPLKESLGKEMEVTNIYFAKDLYGDASIIVEYIDIEDGLKKFFTISQYDTNDINISFELYNTDYNSLVNDNKKKINMAFEEAYQRNFDHEIQIPSTSNLFVIDGWCNEVDILDKKSDALKLSFNLSDYEKGSKIVTLSNIVCANKNVIDCLNNGVNVQNFIKNVKVYEENVPKYLKKVK